MILRTRTHTYQNYQKSTYLPCTSASENKIFPPFPSLSPNPSTVALQSELCCLHYCNEITKKINLWNNNSSDTKHFSNSNTRTHVQQSCSHNTLDIFSRTETRQPSKWRTATEKNIEVWTYHKLCEGKKGYIKSFCSSPCGLPCEMPGACLSNGLSIKACRNAQNHSQPTHGPSSCHIHIKYHIHIKDRKDALTDWANRVAGENSTTEPTMRGRKRFLESPVDRLISLTSDHVLTKRQLFFPLRKAG